MFKSPERVKYTRLVTEVSDDTAPLSSPPPMPTKLPINNITNIGTGPLPKNPPNRDLPPLPCSPMACSTNYYTEIDSFSVNDYLKSAPNLSKRDMAPPRLNAVKSSQAHPQETLRETERYITSRQLELLQVQMIQSAQDRLKRNMASSPSTVKSPQADISQQYKISHSPTSQSVLYRPELDYKTETFPVKDLKYGITEDMVRQYAAYYAHTQQWDKYNNAMKSLEIHAKHNGEWRMENALMQGNVKKIINDTDYEMPVIHNEHWKEITGKNKITK